MHYWGAIRRLFADPLLYVTMSLLIFVPGANLAVLGYMVSLAGQVGPDAPFGDFRKRFVLGANAFVVLVVFLLIPSIALNFYSLQAALIAALVLLPHMGYSLVLLGNGVELEKVFELRHVKRAYSPPFLKNTAKAVLFCFLVFLAQLVVPFVGWIGIFYGPAAVFLILMGETYQDRIL